MLSDFYKTNFRKPDSVVFNIYRAFLIVSRIRAAAFLFAFESGETAFDTLFAFIKKVLISLLKSHLHIC